MMTISLIPQRCHFYILAVWLLCTPFTYAADQMVEERRVAYSALEQKNYKLAYILLNKLAKQGDVYANFNLAHMLETGKGFPVDIKRAIFHYKFAFENGLLAAANNLGVIYANGIDGMISAEQAVYYYKLAADQGNVRAQANLAQLYLRGQIVPQDIFIANTYFTKAAMQNDVHSQYQLGVMYFNGDVVEKNIREAYAWMSLARENGDLQAPYVLEKLKPMFDRAAMLVAEQRISIIRKMIAKNLSQ